MPERANGILLDTSVVVAHLRGLINLQDLTAPGEPLFLPLVAVGELYKGALKSNHPERNRLKIEEFLRVAAILYLDLATAEAYARVADSLEARGTPIPTNDIWISAVAIECDLPLATRDDHFQRVDGLLLLRW